jgi:hypothetical protein
MARHPCDTHPQWHHNETCLHGRCGFCEQYLDDVASGECQICGRIVCFDCDTGSAEAGDLCPRCVRGLAL